MEPNPPLAAIPPLTAIPPIGSMGQLTLDLLLVLLFIVVAGIFVAAEISLISLRESQLRQMEAAAPR